MVSTKKNEDAVSPVIGVILMVAVTVILAAIIAAFVFGMAGNIQSTKVVAFTASNNGTVAGSYVFATNMGGQDVSKLASVASTINGVSSAAPGVSIGNTTQLGVAPSAAGKNRVVLVGTFNDGSTQVLLDSYV